MNAVQSLTKWETSFQGATQIEWETKDAINDTFNTIS